MEIPRSVYRGRIVTSEHDQFLMDESLTKDSLMLHHYIARLHEYTELDCRNLCWQIALRIRTLHEAHVAHRNLFADNIVIQAEVRML